MYTNLRPRGLYVHSQLGLCYLDHAFTSSEVGVTEVLTPTDLNDWLRSVYYMARNHPPTNAEGDE